MEYKINPKKNRSSSIPISMIFILLYGGIIFFTLNTGYLEPITNNFISKENAIYTCDISEIDSKEDYIKRCCYEVFGKKNNLNEDYCSEILENTSAKHTCIYIDIGLLDSKSEIKPKALEATVNLYKKLYTLDKRFYSNVNYGIVVGCDIKTNTKVNKHIYEAAVSWFNDKYRKLLNIDKLTTDNLIDSVYRFYGYDNVSIQRDDEVNK